MPRALVFTDFGGPEFQRFADVETPVPGPNQVLIRTKAIGVNPVDWKLREGHFDKERYVSLPAIIGGGEAAGVVTAVGSDVTGFAVGDEVFGGTVRGTGSFSEVNLLTATRTVKKPAELSFAQVAGLTIAYATALDGINQLDLPTGSTLLITGVGGGVGSAAAQIAIARGLNVIGTASDAKREFVESFGVTHATYGPGLLDRLPGSVDGIYDQVGGAALREVSVLVKDKRKITSAIDHDLVAELGGTKLVRVGGQGPLQDIVDLIVSGKLQPLVRNVFDFIDAEKAIALSETEHATGKIVIEVES
jgi:NADPH:quinone reductase-like Zn-dependent oxidoreductase